MTGLWIVGILMLLSLGAGLLVGTSWSIHALDRRYRRLAIERRELNEGRRALHEASQHQRAASGVLT
jgi:MFS superfamily sulfate permease-like transporter